MTESDIPARLRNAIAADLRHLVSRNSQGKIVTSAYELAVALLAKFPDETIDAVLKQEPVRRAAHGR